MLWKIVEVHHDKSQACQNKTYDHTKLYIYISTKSKHLWISDRRTVIFSKAQLTSVMWRAALAPARLQINNNKNNNSSKSNDYTYNNKHATTTTATTGTPPATAAPDTITIISFLSLLLYITTIKTIISIVYYFY